jgi:hypothetical protein
LKNAGGHKDEARGADQWACSAVAPSDVTTRQQQTPWVQVPQS